MSLKLNLPSGIYVGGQTLRGEAELHFPLVNQEGLEEVHVKLRGSIFTYATVSRQLGKQRFVHRQTVPVVSENVSLWSRASNRIPSDNDVLRIPFEFKIPLNAPPSCHYDAMSKHGRVGYFVELVGARQGVLAKSRRVVRPISVVPEDLQGEQVVMALRGLDTPLALQTKVAEKKIRRGIFGEYANTRLELSFPKAQTYPLFTPIPYTLRVVTVTKPMKKEEEEKKPLFPAPPSQPGEVEFRLHRNVFLKAKVFEEDGDEKVTTLGGLETATSAAVSGVPVDVQVKEKVWTPSAKEKHLGTWTQETTFRSAFLFKCPPTFEAENMHVKYSIKVRIDFPGIGNDLEIEIPIAISSGLSAAPVYTEEADNFAAILDLPPTYWGDAEKWDEEEKEK
ncbi:hypothetical protein BXZ70DRAFT_900966 [Cristinia sonorae]|uniref:Arrestin-like N-terminal domain-containing protein n=1 Tax=Cristinia sonorae TaxID=1940300 RepID=A0A8K0UEU2_9AGAR|nr:hypothetical protein BXZ70DRAFT_900966 [Cristinia sonorae]